MSTSQSTTVSESRPAGLTTRTMVFIAVMTAITCLLAPLSIPIPISPVPITLTNLVILISACLLGWKFAAISCLLYLLLGVAGLPVFSAYGFGIGKLIGPTGGYLVGFLPLAIGAGLIFEHVSHPLVQVILLAAATLFLLYLPGTIWLAFQAGLSFPEALMMGVIPYIPGDLVKIILSVVLGPTLVHSLKRAGIMQ